MKKFDVEEYIKILDVLLQTSLTQEAAETYLFLKKKALNELKQNKLSNVA